MSTNNKSVTQTRRGFLKGAASLAALGSVTAVSSAAIADKQKPEKTTQWVGAGYLIARPMDSDSQD